MPKADAIHFQEGDKAEVTFTEMPENTHEGLVGKIGQEVNPTTQMVQLEIKLQADKLATLVGTAATAIITSQEECPMVSIPIQALASKEGNKGIVYLFGEGTTSATEVVIFKEEKDRVFISNGLSKGDQVVIVQDGFVPDETTVINK